MRHFPWVVWCPLEDAEISCESRKLRTPGPGVTGGDHSRLRPPWTLPAAPVGSIAASPREGAGSSGPRWGALNRSLEGAAHTAHPRISAWFRRLPCRQRAAWGVIAPPPPPRLWELGYHSHQRCLTWGRGGGQRSAKNVGGAAEGDRGTLPPT